MTEAWPAPVFSPIEPPKRRHRGLIITLSVLAVLVLAAGGVLFALGQGAGSTATLRIVQQNNAHADASFVLAGCEIQAGQTECTATNGEVCKGAAGGQQCTKIPVPEDRRLRVQTALGQDAAWVTARLGWDSAQAAGSATDAGSCTFIGEPGQSFTSHPFGAEVDYTITRTNVFGQTETSPVLHGFRMLGHACGEPEDPDHDHDEDGEGGH
ncbi:hypothetical protein [Mycetocola saprophilus]|uniref:hypothetical protein n=1 Tax=Mycetocola saprophilus TaxID=76636 RepID=UPI0004BEE8CE|nr:hypothetical protein [Mycetocola saprophilus]